MASLLPLIKADWGISDTNLGFITGAVSLFVAIFVIPMSYLVDRWSRKYMIIIMALLWSLATILCAFADSYYQLVIFRAMTGIGESAFAPAAVAMISKRFPRQSRASFIGIFNAGAPIGAGLGFMLGGYVGLLLGWRHALGMVALPGVLVALLFFLIKDYRTPPLQESEEKRVGYGTLNSVYNLFKIKTIWVIYIAYALSIAVNTSIMVWIPSYLVRYHAISESRAGLAAGIIAMMVLIGAPLGGKLADLWYRSNTNAKQHLSAITAIVSSIALAAALICQNLTAAYCFFAIFGVTAVMFIAPATSIIQDVVQPGLRAFGYGINVFFENFVGAFTVPVIVGFLSDHVGLKQALLLLPILGITSAALFGISCSYYHKDLHAKYMQKV